MQVRGIVDECTCTSCRSILSFNSEDGGVPCPGFLVSAWVCVLSGDVVRVCAYRFRFLVTSLILSLHVCVRVLGVGLGGKGNQL